MRKDTYNSSGTTIIQTTHYVRDVSGNIISIYIDNSIAEHPIYGLGRIGVFNRPNSSVYELTDHLGNVRATFSNSGNTPLVEIATDYYPFGCKCLEET